MVRITNHFLLVSTLALVLGATYSCELEREPGIAAGVDGCAACGMVIGKQQEAGIYEVDREFHTFCSTGCLLESYEQRRRAGEPPPEQILLADYETGELAPVEAVTFLLTDHRPTTMDWGIAPFSDPDRAEASLRQEEEVLVDWVGLRTLRGKPDQRLSWILRPGGFDPLVMQVRKGELVEWAFEGMDLDEDRRIELRGYEEFGVILVPANGEIVRVRLLATRPGEGFALISVPDGKVLGRLRVEGPHTPDEEQR